MRGLPSPQLERLPLPHCPRDLEQAVIFATMAVQLGIEPRYLASLTVLARRATYAYVNHNMNPSPARQAWLTRSHTNYERLAQALGFRVRWDSFRPSLVKNGQEIPSYLLPT